MVSSLVAIVTSPLVTIETITITRKLKVISFICCAATVFLLVAAICTADWIMADGWRQGLFSKCISDNVTLPLPFDMLFLQGCSPVRLDGYIVLSVVLIIIGLTFDLFASIIFGLALRSTDPNKKYKYYRFAVYTMVVTLIFLILPVVIYPVYFFKKLDEDDNGSYVFGFGWVSTVICIITIFLAGVNIICDRGSQEIFYKERKIEDDEEETIKESINGKE